VSLSIYFPKKLIGKVFLEINREVGQGLFEGTKVRFFMLRSTEGLFIQ
tara:strand:- start:18829 stop:18972 length:144 start_codon:yes stop_codon:yes gene_type:complete